MTNNKRITTWHNVYQRGWMDAGHASRETADIFAHVDRTFVYRIERDEDGSNPTILVEV